MVRMENGEARDAAVIIGVDVAREHFHEHGNPPERCLKEEELATLLALSAYRAIKMNDAG